MAESTQGVGERGLEERPKGLNLPSKKTAKSSSNSPNSPRPQGLSRMPGVLKELLTSRRRRVLSHGHQESPTPSAEFIPSPHTGEETWSSNDYGEREHAKVLKVGYLHKTSQSRKTDAEAGPTRQRRFRLTAESLEYFQQFSHVKIRRTYPLTSLEDIKYPVDGDKQTFMLIYASYVMTLRSESESEAEDWVEKIRRVWKDWQLPTPAESEDSPLALPTLHPITEEDESGVAEASQYTSHRAHTSSLSNAHHLGLGSSATPGPISSNRDLAPQERPRSSSHSGILRRESTEAEFPTYDKRRQHRIRGLRIRKRPVVHRLVKQQPHGIELVLSSKLHEDHAMIKYPRSRWSIPSEKVVNVDKDNLVVIWRHNERALFRRKESTQRKLRSSLGLNKVLEVRKGQLTEKFDQFPYEEVEDQSFSLIFEQVTKRYVRLTSLDLICDSPEKCDDWINGLRETTNHLSCSIFPSELYHNTDPTILWLKQLWATSQLDHEMSQKDALDMMSRFRPGTMPAKRRQILSDSHHNQFRHTYMRGNALRWDGFVLMFNLLLGNGGRLGNLFKKYAIKYPKLGMTVDELRTFLKKECQWPESSCSPSYLKALIDHHEYHHGAYKKYVARGSPQDYQIGPSLLSFAGFLSFLRSKDNSPIDLQHTTIYQDMTQPLSHYFINSSHNTYLEADQLYGKSSTDAYIRTLLQGCRCIEIDCWDGGIGGEPVIYHGYTLTTKLPFREVIHTIKEYAFTASYFPLIISIENHCSSTQQTKMAKIFQAVMGDVLPKENLCEKLGRDRLPSPQELQGKIILKGSFKHGKQQPAAAGRKMGRRNQSQSLSFGQPEESIVSTSSIPTSPAVNEPDPQESLESTAVALLQAKQQLPSRKSLRRSKSSTYRARRQQLKESVHDLKESGQLESTVYQDDDQELIFSETVGDMKSLIVYCRAISLKPWSFERQGQLPVSNMFSFGEPSALRRCDKYPMEMLACTETHLVRTYPRGTRFDSANYPAMNMWQCGVQMVALNFQYPDIHMHLNQGLFRLNGGCGYVLKPEVMRQTNAEVDFDPRMRAPHPDVPPVKLEIELLSGQQLCYWEKKCISCSVDIHTYGIPNDTETGSMSTAYSTDLLWPQWTEGEHVFRKRVLMPELCLVYFRVEVTRGRGAARKTTLYGQNCIPLISLLPGIKYIPLRTPGGELISESGLFLRIKKEEEGEGRREQEEERGDVRGIAHQRRRRKLTHQKEIVGYPGDDDVPHGEELAGELEEEEMWGDEWEEEEGEGGEFPKQRSVTSPPLLESFKRSTLMSEILSSSKVKDAYGPQEVQITAEIHEGSSDLSTQSLSPRGLNSVPRSPAREMLIKPSDPRIDAGGVRGTEGEEDTAKIYSLRFSSFRGAEDISDDVV